MRQAVILVGGLATRLGELASDRPKPFLDVGGEPFIDTVVRHAQCQGITEVILLAGHGADWVQRSYQCAVAGVLVRICIEKTPMGTAGALLSAAEYLDDFFLLLNGDSILAGNWTALYPLLDSQTAVVLATRELEDAGRYGRVCTQHSHVLSFAEKKAVGPGEINAGIYAVQRDLVLPHISGVTSLENDILPQLVSQRKVRAKKLAGYFIDIGLPNTLCLARDELRAKLRMPVAIFDRDNTLVSDDGYTHRVSDLKWLADAKETILHFNNHGYKVMVVTNQAGIARGYYREEDMHAFHQAMQSDLYQIGAHIDGFYHCPHHIEGTIANLAQDCRCRKPKTGLLEDMFVEHSLDKKRSFMIGDSGTDVACGESFGLQSFKYEGGSLLSFCQKQRLRP